jgi:peptide/nickel transport system substrate-binding protein
MSWLQRLVLIALAAASPLVATPQAWAAANDTVVVAQGVDLTTLDPMNHQEAAATVVANNLFDGLIERDPDFNLVPLLAESYRSVSPTTWEFKLRRGIRFQNGEPFDAESVKFSLERLIDPKLKLRGASAFTPLTHVEIVDPLTVRVHSKAGWPLLPAVLTTGQAAMLPPKYYRTRTCPTCRRIRWARDRSSSCAG